MSSLLSSVSKVSRIGGRSSSSGHSLVMSVTRIHADFFPFTNSERGRELIGCKIDSLVF